MATIREWKERLSHRSEEGTPCSWSGLRFSGDFDKFLDEVELETDSPMVGDLAGYVCCGTAPVDQCGGRWPEGATLRSE